MRAYDAWRRSIDIVMDTIKYIAYRPLEKFMELFKKNVWNTMVKHHKITYAVLLGTLLIGFITQ